MKGINHIPSLLATPQIGGMEDLRCKQRRLEKKDYGIGKFIVGMQLVE